MNTTRTHDLRERCTAVGLVAGLVGGAALGGAARYGLSTAFLVAPLGVLGGHFAYALLRRTPLVKAA